MKPVLKIGGHDYTAFVLELEPVRNDLDADGSGRDILSGEMFRTRIAQKDKWSIKFIPLPESIMSSIAEDIDSTFINVSLLDPKTNSVQTKTYYASSLTYGSQRYHASSNQTYYEGCTFNIVER